MLLIFRGGGSVEAYEGVLWSLLWRLERLEMKLAIIRSEWDVFICEIHDHYTRVEAIEKVAELSKRQTDTLDEINEVKRLLREVTMRES